MFFKKIYQIIIIYLKEVLTLN